MLATDVVGTILGDRYQLDELIGSGAMGRVYKGHHLKINRHYAIKLLHPHLLMDPKTCKRFAQEAELAASLDHPNVVGVVDAGDCDHGYYLVMELAQGVTLTHVLAGAPLEGSHAIELLVQICDGLQHAHDRGAIHRDLKPDNIIVDDAGRVRIVDFGIATMNDDVSSGKSGKRERLTSAGLMLGTPQYMAPCLATGQPYDHRVDLFALGVIAYEMLTGRLPFDGDGVDAVRANVSRATPPMGVRVPTVIVDPLMEAFTRMLMAKDPRDRPATARAARELLDLIDRDRPAAARALHVSLATGSFESPSPAPAASPSAQMPQTKRARNEALAPTVGLAELAELRLRPRRNWLAIGAIALAAIGIGIGAYAALRPNDKPVPAVAYIPPPVPSPAMPTTPILPPPVEPIVTPSTPPTPVTPAAPAPIARPRSDAHPTSAAPARPAPIAIVTDPTAEQLGQLYIEVGKRLKAHPDDALWARFRRIRLQDALGTQELRNEASSQLRDIAHSLR